MIKNKTDILFEEYTTNIANFIDGNKPFYKFRDEINRGDQRYALSMRYVDRNVDIAWIDKIESTVIALDTIIRNPRSYIANVEEILPVEMSHKISSESVKHLATHTGFIQSVDEEQGKVTPSKLLNVFHEESFATYENRFIKTLLITLEIFVEKRYQGLIAQKDVDNVASSMTEQTFHVGHEKVEYSMSIKVSRNQFECKTNDSKALKTNVIERVEKIRKIIRDFMKSEFMSNIKEAANVHPPITKTNLLTKNQDYKKALELWQFIESYTKSCYEVQLVNDSVIPPNDYQEQINEIAFIQYILLKKYANGEADESITSEMDDFLLEQYGLSAYGSVGGGFKGSSRSHITEKQSKLLRRQFRKILGNYFEDLDEVKRIFVDEIEKRNRAIEREEKKILDAVKRCLDEKLLQLRKQEEKKRRMEERAIKRAQEQEKKKAEKAKIRAKKKLERERMLTKKIEAQERIKKVLQIKQKKLRDQERQKKISEQERIKKALKLKQQKARKELSKVELNAKEKLAKSIIKEVTKKKQEENNKTNSEE